MIRYINTKLYGQKETIDQLDSNDFNNYSEFKKELTRLLKEYRICGGYGSPYSSQRKCK